MSLNGLPDEIVLIIGHHVRCRSDLAALYRSSRRLRILTRPILYRKIRCRDGQELDEHMVPLLLSSILRDRALGEYVQVLDISPGGYGGGGCFTDEDKMLIQKAIEEILETGFIEDDDYIYEPDLQTWCENVCKGQWDATIAIVLFLCPGLRKLRFVKWTADEGDEEEESYIVWFMNIVSRSQQDAILRGIKRADLGVLSKALKHSDLKHRVPLLPHLRHGKFELALKYGQIDDGVKVELLHFIQPPSLETFYIRGIMQYYQFRPNMRLGLKKLVMEQCVCEANTIASMLRACAQLEDFSYEHGHKEAVLGAVDPLLLMKGLLCLTESLRRLRFARAQREFWHCNLATYCRLGSLANFRVLTHLSVPIEFIRRLEILTDNPNEPYYQSEEDENDPLTMGLWKLVPVSLEYLFIDGVEEELLLAFAEQDLHQLVLRKWSFAPKLRHIVIGKISREEAVSGSALTPLKEACTANEVCLTTQIYTLVDDYYEDTWPSLNFGASTGF